MNHPLIKPLRIVLAADRSEASRQKWEEWTNYLIDQKIDLIDLMDLLDAEHPIAMRFTWLLGHILVKAPDRIAPIVSHCFNRRDELTFPGIKRTIAKMIWLAGVPEELEGLVVDELFKWVLSPQIKVAVKVYSISALYDFSVKYPDLQEELLLVIDDQLDKNPVAFSARARKILKLLRQ
ncbi:hypothetical protein [Aureispira anguillae]|uniref:Uncharacterized protein n=1 Tax=Aureispira anguillae TaxID=2864201 RepID=A0A916DWP3_9BACT|nr:hypothetical protein [Aureispira anguillae]BDS15027.1 hypothetical protein AsAng_0058090 [Aureispira anguillae]